MGILQPIENDLSVKQDINPINGSGTTGLTSNEDKKVKQEPEKTIVMDGPLSAIYTKALNLVYSKNTEEAISTETQQMDAVLVADAHNFLKKKEEIEKLEEGDNAAYVYVTTSDIARGQAAQTFDDLRIALDMDTNVERVICIECMGNVDLTKIATLTNYIETHKRKPKLFYTRSETLAYLSR